jgi:hypothetical protein
MRHVGIVVGVVLYILAAGKAVSFADGSSVSGKTVAFAATGSISTSGGEILTATITHGRPHSVLSIDESVTGYLAPGDYFTLAVNGLTGDGVIWPTSIMSTDCTSGLCTVTGQFWLDLDAAEGIFPGRFINQPVEVDLYSSVVGYPYTAALRLRLDKKK